MSNLIRSHYAGKFINEQVGHQRWVVHEEFSFTNSSGVVTTVEAGFEHDFGSIPAIAQGIVSKVGYWDPACVVHDWQHRQHREGRDTTRTRAESNRDLLEGCKVLADLWDVADCDRRDWLIYGAVMAAGPEHWETPEERVERLAKPPTWEYVHDQ